MTRRLTKTLPTWRQMNMDTSPEVERIHFALIKAKPLWHKMKLLMGMERNARSLVLVGLRRRYPKASKEELQYLAREKLYGNRPNRTNGINGTVGGKRGGQMTEYQTVDIALMVTDTLDRLGIPYLVGGSLVSIMYGMVRYTNDADLVADIKPYDVNAFVQALSDRFYVYDEAILGAIEHQSSFNVIHLESSIKVDVFVAKQRAFDREQFRRRTEEVIEFDSGRTAWVCTPEDIILAKLEWFRLGGQISERQWRDVLGVIKVQGDSLDEDYLQKWAKPLGVSDLIERALEEGKRAE